MRDKIHVSKKLLPSNGLIIIILLKLFFCSWKHAAFAPSCGFRSITFSSILFWFFLILFSIRASPSLSLYQLWKFLQRIQLSFFLVIFCLPPSLRLSPHLPICCLAIGSHSCICQSPFLVPHLLSISFRCPLSIWKPSPAICEMMTPHSDATFL